MKVSGFLLCNRRLSATGSFVLRLYAALVVCMLSSAAVRGADYVITISVDGMGSSYVKSLMDDGKLPVMKRISSEGSGTLDARTDFDITVTLPNHISMITSRSILGESGHSWSNNGMPAKGVTLHSKKGSYVASVFDVVHDHGRRTGLWSTKQKFILFDVSYSAKYGAPDLTAPDDGPVKLDQFYCLPASQALTDHFITVMSSNPCHYAFIHYGDTDAAGHSYGWGSEAFRAELIRVDGCLGRIMAMMTSNSVLKNHSALILTADHGGYETNHEKAEKPLNYTIPFFVWGAGVAHGDLYGFNKGRRVAPEERRPDYSAQPQPIRNGDAGNLGLFLLGLGPIPGSSINAKQDLRVSSGD